MAEVNVGHGRSKNELKADFDAALRRHHVDHPESVADVMAEIAWAGTGPRPLLLPRLARLGARLAIQGVRYLRDLRLTDDEEESDEEDEDPGV